MIYLIDDKKLRQERDYQWNKNRFQNKENIIQPIYTLEELQNRSSEIFQEGNVVLYHESFLDKTDLNTKASIKRDKLVRFQEKRNSYLVIFSGGINTITLNKNIAYMPVSTLYQNLDVFVDKYSSNDLDIRYLLFGNNLEIEERLEQVLQEKLNKILKEEPIAANIKGENFFVRPSKNYISNPIKNVDTGKIFNKVSDQDISKMLREWFGQKNYDNIFIPLCFGPTLSDFNGLRLATHIRCSKTQSQRSRIFIYGFVGVTHILNNQYFNILKTKNIELIDFNKKSMMVAGNSSMDELTEGELPKEIKKLKLDPPNNYFDDHSIANEWAIYCWANAIDTSDDDIDKISKKIKNDLYFKYLKTIFPVSKIDKISKGALKINGLDKNNILYIDDEAEKGWYEIFCAILCDINDLENFDYISEDFKNKTREEIIDISLNRVREQNTDIVILDFRLHQRDFEEKNIKEITGLRLLQEIKKINPGIQVIIFSATNKIWNLQELQNAGVNGFIVKESPENSADKDFTVQSILSFKKNIKERAKMTFLKQFYSNFILLERELLPRKNVKKSNNPLPKEFVDETLKWFKLSIDTLNVKRLTDSKKASSFLFLFSVLENLSNRLIDTDNPIYVGKDHKNRDTYSFEFRNNHRKLRNFDEEIDNKGCYIKSNKNLKCGKYHIPWHQKILNTLDFITDEEFESSKLSGVIKKRNDFIHSNSTTGDKFDIKIEDIKWLHRLVFDGLRNVV